MRKVNSYYKSSARAGWRPKTGDKVIAVLLDGDMSTSMGNIWSDIEWNDEHQQYEVIIGLKDDYEWGELIEGQIGEVIGTIPQSKENALSFVKIKFVDKIGYTRLSYIEPYNT